MLLKSTQTKREIIKRAFLSGTKKVQSQNFTLRVIEGKNRTTPNLFSVIVSKKEVRLAVVRNFIKRRVRSIIEKNKTHLKNGNVIVVVARAHTQHEPFKDLEKEIHTLFVKANLFKK